MPGSAGKSAMAKRPGAPVKGGEETVGSVAWLKARLREAADVLHSFSNAEHSDRRPGGRRGLHLVFRQCRSSGQTSVHPADRVPHPLDGGQWTPWIEVMLGDDVRCEMIQFPRVPDQPEAEREGPADSGGRLRWQLGGA